MTTLESDVVTTSETDVGTTHFRPCRNVVTTLSQRRCASRDGAEGELFSLLKNHLQNREKRKMVKHLDGEKLILAGPLLFLIYIYDLPDRITSMCKIFADDTFLFPKVLGINKSVTELNTDLEKISQ